MRKRRGLSAEVQNDGKEVIASELVDRIEANGAALLNAARRMKIHSR